MIRQPGGGEGRGGRVHGATAPPAAPAGNSHRSDDPSYIVNRQRRILRGHAFIASLNHHQQSRYFHSETPYLRTPLLQQFRLVKVSIKYVPVSVRLPIRGAQLAALRGRRKLLNPGEEQQTLVAGLPLQLGGNRLHPSLVHRKNTGEHHFLTLFLFWSE